MTQGPTVIPIPINSTDDPDGLLTGTPVVYTATTAMGGLVSGATYYVIALDPGHVELASSAANAEAGTAIGLRTSGASGDQALTLPDGTKVTFARRR